MEYLIGKRRVRPAPSQAIGKGGEADVYNIGEGLALKVFKPPTHPDFAGLPDEQRNAQRRIEEHQAKLPSFPKGLPDHVIVPVELALTRANKVAGYTMRLLSGADVILNFAKKDWRQGNPQVTDHRILKVFRDLHTTVGALHETDVIIGDFNDLNVMVIGEEAFLIDADSMQFGQFPCRVFTERFVDPRLCDPTKNHPLLVSQHDCGSDWFAYSVMLFQSLLWVGPYGGVYKATQGEPKVGPGERSLKGISILHPNGINYPRPARKPELLPDDLLHYFFEVFEKGHRGVFPVSLLEVLRWTTCTNCGAIHARSSCPLCKMAAPTAVIQRVVIHGRVKATTVFPSSHARGTVLKAVVENGKLKWIYEEQGMLKRETGDVVTRGQLTKGMKFAISGERTLVGMGEKLILFEQNKAPKAIEVDQHGSSPVFDSNTDHVYWSRAGELQRDGILGVDTPERIGNVLQGQSLIWTGETFGFGFYRAGDLFQAFVFDTKNRNSLNDNVKFPRIRGQLVDAHCQFSSQRAWVFTTTQESGRLVNRCVVLDNNGSIQAEAEAEAGDGSWLGNIRGHCATTLPGKGGTVRHVLFVPTDEGMVRIEAENGNINETVQFPDTKQWVDSSTHLYLTQDGIAAVTPHSITILQMS